MVQHYLLTTSIDYSIFLLSSLLYPLSPFLSLIFPSVHPVSPLYYYIIYIIMCAHIILVHNLSADYFLLCSCSLCPIAYHFWLKIHLPFSVPSRMDPPTERFFWFQLPFLILHPLPLNSSERPSALKHMSKWFKTTAVEYDKFQFESWLYLVWMV